MHSRLSPALGRFRRSGGAILVLTGTFVTPIAQWVVFFLIALQGGASVAGELALLIAIANPIFTATNFGLRNGYITLQERHPYDTYLRLRLTGTLVGAIAMLLFGCFSGASAWFVVLVLIQKSADAVLDLEFGRLQRERRLTLFGALMTTNGVLTVVLAFIAVLIGLQPTAVLASTAAGSVLTLIVVIVINIHFGRAREKEPRDARRQSMRKILIACWPIAAGQILAILVVNVPFWAVALAGTTDDVGRFAAAAYMITVGSLLGSSLNSMLIGKYQHLMSDGHQRTVIRSSRLAALVSLGVGVLIAIVLIFLGPALFAIIYGDEFHFTGVELAIIALSAAFNPGTHLMNAALLAVNLYRRQMSVVLWALIVTVLAALLCYAAGVTGFMIGAMSSLAGGVTKFLMSFTSFPAQRPRARS